MIPILFNGTATDFTTNGVGRLTDVISCKVTEERNGLYELEMEVATTSPWFERIVVGSLIVATPYVGGTRQAFEVYKISKPTNQKVTVNATHLSYRASYIPVAPFVAEGITDALQGLHDNALETNPFSLSSDFTNEESTLDIVSPKSLRACLGGTENSLLDVFAGGGAGEFLFDNWNINFLMHRGRDRGVYLRYGKNITDLTHVENIEDMITGVLPYWQDEELGIVVQGDIQYSPNASLYPQKRTVVLDLSTEFETEPSLYDLNQAGLEYITSATVGIPNESIEVSFIDLSQTGEQAVLEQVNLCDTVHVVYAPLNITFEAKVIKTVYDVLADRYESITIGNPKSSLAKTLSDNLGDISEMIQTGKKLVSVTQTINRELGEITSSVATVQGSIAEVDNRLTQQIQTQATAIQQNAQEIVLRALQQTVDQELGAVDGRIQALETYVSISTDGLTIKQNDDGSYVLVTDNGMEIYVNNQRQAYATTEGFNASTFITGEWHIQPANNGNSLNFFKKEA